MVKGSMGWLVGWLVGQTPSQVIMNCTPDPPPLAPYTVSTPPSFPLIMSPPPPLSLSCHFLLLLPRVSTLSFSLLVSLLFPSPHLSLLSPPLYTLFPLLSLPPFPPFPSCVHLPSHLSVSTLPSPLVPFLLLCTPFPPLLDNTSLHYSPCVNTPTSLSCQHLLYYTLQLSPPFPSLPFPFLSVKHVSY